MRSNNGNGAGGLLARLTAWTKRLKRDLVTLWIAAAVAAYDLTVATIRHRPILPRHRPSSRRAPVSSGRVAAEADDQ